jgi:hypothetical protein
MKKYLSTMILLGASMTVAIPQVWAQTHKAAPKASAAAEPEMKGFHKTDFNCELGNKLTIYEKANDSKSIGLKWGKTVHELTRVETTTGANRFENRQAGLVWIGIPAKGMLLDSKKGHQLANECKSADQTKAKSKV